ncbi:MAG TPA: hypothetical protein DIC60_04840 [Lachnospiraceae bacterium]|nr:hypothetical protein [Lachnospiraceae bacterium]
MNRVKTFVYIAIILGIFMLLGIYLQCIPFLGFPLTDINIAVLGRSVEQANGGEMFSFAGDSILIPFGYRFNEMFGLILILKFFLSMGISEVLSFSISYFIMYVVSFTSLFLLLNKFAKNKIIILTAMILFYIDPFLSAQHGITAFFVGIMMLPFSILIDFIYLQKFHENENFISKGRRHLFVLSIIARLITVSMGWYTAVIYATGSCLFFLIYFFFIRKNYNIKNLIYNYIYIIILPWILGMFVILLLTPSSAASYKSSLSFYSGTSVDFITLLLPMNKQFITKFIPSVKQAIGDFSLTGDGTMWYNYIGYTIISTIVFSAFKEFKRNKKSGNKPNKIGINNILVRKTLIIIALATFFISLGPSFKFKGLIEKTAYISYSQYLYSLDKAFVFPWFFIFKVFPLSSMRAVYRWIVLTKMFLLLLFTYYIQQIYVEKKIKNNIVIYLLCAVSIIEFVPLNIFDFNVGKNKIKTLNEIVEHSITEIKELDLNLNKNDRCVFCSYNFSSNNFLSPLVTNNLGISTYSGCGDKAIATAKEYIPNDILNIQSESDPKKLATSLKTIKEKKLCEFVIFPYFDMRTNASNWPPSNFVISETKDIATEVKNIMKNEVVFYETEYYMIADLREEDDKTNNIYNLLLDDRNLELKTEKKILGSENYLEVNNDESYTVELANKNDCDSVYLNIYVRADGSSNDSEQDTMLNVVSKDKDYNVLEEKNYIINPNCDEYKLFEYEIGLPENTEYICLEIKTSANDKKLALKDVYSCFYNDKEIKKNTVDEAMDNISYNKVKNSKNVAFENNQIIFNGEGYVNFIENNQMDGKYFDYGLKLWLDENSNNINSSTIVTKWSAWANDMSFALLVKEGKYGFLFSNDGNNVEGIWISKEKIPFQQWNDLQIIFDNGNCKIYNKGIKIAEEKLSFAKVYTNSDLITVGANVVGKVEKFYFKTEK